MPQGIRWSDEQMVGAPGNFCTNWNFDGPHQQNENSDFLDFQILLPWGHFGRTFSALGVCYEYGW